MATIRFFPIDITYKLVRDRAVIYMYGRTTDDKQICVTDSNFEPYFYVLPKKNADVAGFIDKISRLRVERKTVSFVRGAEVVEKKFFGKKVSAVKVIVNQPKDVSVIRNEIKENEDVDRILEADVLFARRYLIDKNIIPLNSTDVEGNFVNERSKVPVFNATKIEQTGADYIGKPRVLAFDIETYNPFRKATVPEKYPVIMISFYSEGFKKVVTWKRFKTKHDYIEFVDGEAELLTRFKAVIDEFKPDILTGYFSDGFDFPYIRERAKKYKIDLDIGLDYSNVQFKKRVEGAVITGIVHIDIFNFVKRVISQKLETDTYTLDAVSKELLNKGKKEVDMERLASVWDKENEKLEPYCEYNLQDSLLTYEIFMKLLPNMTELSRIIGLTLYDVNGMGFSRLVEWYLMRRAFELKELAPSKPHSGEIGKRRMQTYKGAFVFEPKPGLYKSVVVLDFRSLYPTIITSHNISPETLNCDCCEDAEKAPEEKYWFCKKKKGFIPTVIEEVVTRRQRIKEIMEKTEKEKKILDARQESLKLLSNSFYGYLGFFAARWYSIECAKSITAWGRHYIQNVIKKAQEAGFMVLYSDTDSIFLVLEKKTKADVDKFLEEVNVALPGLMELEYEGLYPVGLFVSAKEGAYGAKKKYALLAEDGTIKIRGFEMVRRNWSFIAKEAQEKVLEIILKENDTEKALKYVKDVVEKLRQKQIPIDKVIIFTQLQKEIADYDSIGPHVAVATRMRNKGMEVGPGSMIQWVVTQGKDKIRDRARLPEEVKESDYDADYYINNQVIPSVERIFNVLGYKKEDLIASKEQSKLGEFG